MNPDSVRPTDRADVIVIGGGIGGLGAALALSRLGQSVRVYEKAPEFGEVGAGLQLAPNCTRILAEYGLLDQARRLGVEPPSMIMLDAVDGQELTRLDLVDVERRYGFPYLVIHRSDLHGLLLDACRMAGVETITDAECTRYSTDSNGAEVEFTDGRMDRAEIVIAADGLHSVARRMLVDDEPVSSSYVAYRGVVPAAADPLASAPRDVVLHVGPQCHFVQYPLRGGELLNQVAVFESPSALAGDDDWGQPHELDAAFGGTSAAVQAALPAMWRDRWWRMFDRDPIDHWVSGRIALLGDAAHAPLQYMAQGAIMAIEDGWVLARHVQQQGPQRSAHSSGVDWASALAAYESVRVEHCRRVVTTARSWGRLWHLDGIQREQRNAILRARETHDYRFTDWIFGSTALDPGDEPPMFKPIPLSTADVGVPGT